MTTTRQVYVPKGVLGFMEGTGLGQTPDDVENHGYGEGGRRLGHALRETPRYKRGGIMIDADPEMIDVLWSYCGVIIDANSDEPDHAELKAARKLLADLES